MAIALFHIVDRLTPRIPFVSINQSPEAVGIYAFGYLVFLGLILLKSIPDFFLMGGIFPL